MRLPNGEFAVVPDDKLFGYILNPLHPRGAGHAELFRSLLDIDAARGEVLREALLRAARVGDARRGKPSAHGEKYEIRFSMTGHRGPVTILSVWIIETGMRVPRLVTAFVE